MITRSTLKKILALAKEGVGGERKNAEEIINKLLKENKISVTDLEGHVESEEFFKFHFGNENEELLACQVIYKVANKNSFQFYRGHGNAKYFHAKLKPSQYLQAEYLYGVYLDEMRKEMKALSLAFILRNKIYSEEIASPKEVNNAKSYSDEEKERINRILDAQVVVPVNKALA